MRPTKRRVVVTGMGVVSTLGSGVDAFWQRCLQGHSCIEKIPGSWKTFADFEAQYWAPLPTIDYASQGIPKHEIIQKDPVILNSYAAAIEALAQAGLCTADSKLKMHLHAAIDPSRFGCIVGTGIGGVCSVTSFSSTYFTRPLRPKRTEDAAAGGDEYLNNFPKILNKMAVSRAMPSSVSAELGIKFGLHGKNHTVNTACSSGTTAIVEAYNAIALGEMDLALTGASEFLNDGYGVIFKSFDLLGALARRNDLGLAINRPFDEKRSGFLFSAGGAGILILEELSSAEKRGAPILAEIKAGSHSFDAHNIYMPKPEGTFVKDLIKTLLQDAALDARDVDYINTHGTATEINDAIESSILESTFPDRPLINASKGILGHSLGASGALEAIITVLSLKQSVVHPNVNLDQPISQNLQFPLQKTAADLKNGLTYSFAFGGHNSGLILGKC